MKITPEQFDRIVSAVQTGQAVVEKRLDGKNWVTITLETGKETAFDWLAAQGMTLLGAGKYVSPISVFLSIMSPTPMGNGSLPKDEFTLKPEEKILMPGRTLMNTLFPASRPTMIPPKPSAPTLVKPASIPVKPAATPVKAKRHTPISQAERDRISRDALRARAEQRLRQEARIRAERDKKKREAEQKAAAARMPVKVSVTISGKWGGNSPKQVGKAIKKDANQLGKDTKKAVKTVKKPVKKVKKRVKKITGIKF